MNSQPTLFTQKHKHPTHKMHANSKAAWKTIKTSKRAQQILDFASQHQPMTDRQLRNAMGFDDLNQVRPRVTELHDLGKMFEYATVKCSTTGKTVRVNGVRGVHERKK